MNVDKIDFCESYILHFSGNEISFKLNPGILIGFRFVDDYLCLRTDSGEEMLSLTDSGRSNILRAVRQEQDRGGTAFLRVDYWYQNVSGQLTFLVFQSEQCKHLGVNSESGAFEIGWTVSDGKRMSIKEAEKEFILTAPDSNQYIFMRSSEKDENGRFDPERFSLIGEHKFCDVERGHRGGWDVKTSCRPRRSGQEIYGSIYLVGEKIRFVDGAAAQSAWVNQEYSKLVADQNNSELLRLWDEYSKVEEEYERNKAEEYAKKKLSYTSYRYQQSGSRIEFSCPNMNSARLKDFAKCDIGFAVISTEEGARNPLNKEKQIYISDQMRISDADPTKLIANIDFDDEHIKDIPHSGYLVPSVIGLGHKNKRRENARRNILQGKCQLKSLKLIIQAGNVYEEMGKAPLPVNLLNEKVFGPESEYRLNEKQMEAISVAVNTPDVALIQGPPGTGKTSIIKGILAYLENKGKKEKQEYSILISSESHFAVDQAIKGTEYDGLRCKRLGGRFGKNKSGTYYDEWVENELRIKCEEYLESHAEKEDYRAEARAIAVAVGTCRHMLLHHPILSDEMDQALRDLDKSVRLAWPDTQYPARIQDFEESLDRLRECDFNDDRGRLTALLDAQKLTPDAFDEYRYDELYHFISQNSSLLPKDFADLPTYWEQLDESDTDDDDFNELLLKVRKDVELIQRSVATDGTPEDPAAEQRTGIFEMLGDIESELQDNKNKNQVWSITSAVSNFLEHIDDESSTVNFLSSYSKYAGATCQQATTTRFGNWRVNPVKQYDYVIIDEAAKANPLDLLIPMSMGKRIILIGDHKQLPHMVENNIVDEVIKRQETDQTAVSGENSENGHSPEKTDAGKTLKESLFSRMYDYMLRSGCGRTVMLQEQFRMHPAIAQVVSNAFYGGELNSVKNIEQSKRHNIARYSDSPLVWIDLPFRNNEEEKEKKENGSYYRKCEVDRAKTEVEAILRATDDDFSIGVISFYSAQVSELETALKEIVDVNKKREIKVGTVDAFQGQEFDAVILSTVRSNEMHDETKPMSAIGFLAAKQRQNVAFSRAKKLLIVIGDSGTLTRFDINDDEKMLSTKSFKDLYEACKERRAVVYE